MICVFFQVQPCLAEFIGTMMLVFVGAMVVRTDNILAIAAGHGFILAAICAAFGGIRYSYILLEEIFC